MRYESPLAESVARMLREKIEEGSIPMGRPLPSERELAERFEVSRTMVRKALEILRNEGWLRSRPHHRPVVSVPSERDPVQTAATKENHVSVWLWPFTDDFTVSSIFRGIQKGMRGRDLRVVIAAGGETRWSEVLEAEERFLQECCDDEGCAGSIVWLLGGEQSLPALQKARVAGKRLVFIDRKPPAGFDADFVGTENVSAASQLVGHLIGLGHRRIACVTNMDEVSTVADRFEGYRRALAEGGIEFDPDLVVRHELINRESETQSLERLGAKLMGLPNPPTAVFAVNDSIALILSDVFERTGFPVPESVSVAGFDGLLRWLPGGGRLTTAYQDFNRMGELAAELLLERIDSPESRTYRHVLLDAPTQVLGSTAPPRRDDEPGRKTDTQVELVS
ncbi:MAG TPA: GntR family transcriptional regulator [Fimbriimonas sp.]